MTTPRSRILGLGTYVPPRVVRNHDLAKVMDTSHDWIVERSGVEERHWVDAAEGNYTMGVKAARAALADAGAVVSGGQGLRVEFGPPRSTTG